MHWLQWLTGTATSESADITAGAKSDLGNVASTADGLASGDAQPLRGAGGGRRGRGVAPVQPVGDDAANWERFHLRCNKSARFYKERRRASPQPPPTHAYRDTSLWHEV